MKRGLATIRIDLAETNADPGTIAAALKPDDTAEMDAHLDGTVLETHIERASAGGLQSTIDDYLLNLGVAIRVTMTATGVDPEGHSAMSDSTNERREEDAEGSP